MYILRPISAPMRRGAISGAFHETTLPVTMLLLGVDLCVHASVFVPNPSQVNGCRAADKRKPRQHRGEKRRRLLEHRHDQNSLRRVDRFHKVPASFTNVLHNETKWVVTTGYDFVRIVDIHVQKRPTNGEEEMRMDRCRLQGARESRGLVPSLLTMTTSITS